MTGNAIMVETETCSCIRELHRKCETLLPTHRPQTTGEWMFKDPEMGRVAYTISILIMFALVIVLLMIRSIRRSNSAIEVDALLDAMRFREELDYRERQRRRLLKAKNKVTAWLTRTNGDPRDKTTGGGRVWQSSPQLIPPRKKSSSTVSEIPEIVVTDDGAFRRAHTPCLSLIYDFNEHKQSTDSMVRFQGVSPRGSVCSTGSASSRRNGSFSLDLEVQGSSRNLLGSQQSLSFG